jgi:uncharacterized Zn finger protein
MTRTKSTARDMVVRELELHPGQQQQFEVDSPSGNTYAVTYEGSGDADPEYVALWSCTCPAYRFGRDCKHIAAVVAQLDEFEA